MRPAAVGFQCPQCVAQGTKETRSGRTTYGGKRSANPALTTQVLIALNVAVWLLITVTGGSGSVWVQRLALLPQSALRGRTVIRGVADGDAYWQFLTSMFTHVEIWHIGFNMLALYIFGPQLEALLGRSRYLTLYLLSGLAGGATVYWLSAPNVLTLGASGAIFGLFAAFLLVAVKLRQNVVPLFVLLGINLVITLRPGVSWQGHLGGFVAGLLLGALFVYVPRPLRRVVHGLGSVVFGALVVLAIAARTLLLT